MRWDSASRIRRALALLNSLPISNLLVPFRIATQLIEEELDVIEKRTTLVDGVGDICGKSHTSLNIKAEPVHSICDRRPHLQRGDREHWDSRTQVRWNESKTKTEERKKI